MDVVFEDNPYLNVTERPIRSSLLLHAGDDLLVRLPDKNCILGDKLTAFAPHTTGIPFGKDKELEIIKQMFDCWTLIQEMDDYQTLSSVYNTVSHIELGYRGLEWEEAGSVRKIMRTSKRASAVSRGIFLSGGSTEKMPGLMQVRLCILRPVC